VNVAWIAILTVPRIVSLVGERVGEGSEIEVVLAEVIDGEIIFWLGATV
jgi:hypothetical protein